MVRKKNVNVVTGDEFWIHFFEALRKISTRVWLTKDARRTCIAKRIPSVKKVVYSIFFSTKELAIQVPLPKGKSAKQGFIGKEFLESFSIFSRHADQSGYPRHLLHGNASIHKSGSVISFLNEQGVYVLEHLPYILSLAHCDLLLFPRLKKTCWQKIYIPPKVGIFNHI